MKMNSTECKFQEAKAEELQRGRGFNKTWEASSKFGAAEAGWKDSGGRGDESRPCKEEAEPWAGGDKKRTEPGAGG